MSPTRRTDTNTTGSVASGRSSPHKAFTSLEVQPDDGITRRDLSLIDNDLPGPVADFLSDIVNLAAGVGVISPSSRDAITSHPKRIFRVGLDNSVYSADRDVYGPTPSTAQVLRILEASSKCDNHSHDESSWNMEVHHRVLETALRFPSGSNSSDLFCQPVNFISATSASIGMGKPPSAPFQKIDFCLYIDADNPAIQGGGVKAIEQMRLRLGEQYEHYYINHTNHTPLRNNPITVSIESKRSIDGWDKANLQLAVWQAAQWKFLRWIAGWGGGVDDDVAEGVETGEPDETGEAADIGLPFIPGIVIARHAWYLTVTTNDGKRTVCLDWLLVLLLYSPLLFSSLLLLLPLALPYLSPSLLLLSPSLFLSYLFLVRGY